MLSPEHLRYMAKQLELIKILRKQGKIVQGESEDQEEEGVEVDEDYSDEEMTEE